MTNNFQKFVNNLNFLLIKRKKDGGDFSLSIECYLNENKEEGWWGFFLYLECYLKEKPECT